MNFKQFIVEPSDKKNGNRHRTVNLDVDLHQFYKRTASHYDIPMANLLHNVLVQWRNQYEEEIKQDMLKELGQKK
ncbi:MAG: hypothetical protein RIF46_01360 [Cyclobacteriaceae bacterium]